MNDKLFELEINKILQEYKLLLLDIEYKNEIISENKEEFIREINKKGGFNESEPEIIDSDIDSDIDDSIDDSIELDEKTKKLMEGMKKLYRKIVKLTHPDKTSHKKNKDKLTDLYIRSKKAMSTMDIYELLTICDTLDIEYVIDINHKEILEDSIVKKKEEINSLEVSFVWLWINAKTDLEKDSIVDLFVSNNKK